jgi:hypothetical protein
VLVDVVPLRHAGRKLPRDVVLSAVPTRGDLIIEISTQGYRGGEVPAHQNVALFSEEYGHRRDLLPGLTDALVKIKGSDMVIRGTEHVRQRQGEPVVAYPQAWWCRIV